MPSHHPTLPVGAIIRWHSIRCATSILGLEQLVQRYHSKNASQSLNHSHCQNFLESFAFTRSGLCHIIAKFSHLALVSERELAHGERVGAVGVAVAL